ncbi:MAG: IS21 family transposase [bacterium]|nr:IS21 family transposase [bacterium]
MIPHDIEERILRLHFVEKWHVGTIAKQCSVHHSTVRRVLHDRGVPAAPSPRPSMVDPFLPFIEATLKEYPTLPASRLHAMVAERGYRGAEGHFRRIIARLRPRKPAEAYQRLRTLAGEEAQVDWGHFGNHRVGRATRPVSAFVMVLSWSRMPFVRFFYDQRMGSFLAGHADAFRFFEGVPRVLLYDNLKSVVLSRRGDAVQFNPTALDFAAHYRFEPRPVAVRRGNEKGRVERTIRYLRTSFWPARTWDDLTDLNAQALAWCRDIAGQRACPEDDTMTVREAWANEQARLLPLPDDNYPAHDRVDVRVGKQPYVRFDKNDYSVPHDRVRRTLTVHATPDSVRVMEGNELVADHVRSFDKGEQVENLDHLMALAKRKREARQARGIDRLHHAVPSSGALLEGAARRGHNLGSAVAALLRLVDTWGAADVESAVDKALAADALHVAAVRQVLEQRAQDAGTPPPLPVALPDDPRVRDVHVTPHDLASYDLGGTDV